MEKHKQKDESRFTWREAHMRALPKIKRGNDFGRLVQAIQINPMAKQFSNWKPMILQVTQKRFLFQRICKCVLCFGTRNAGARQLHHFETFSNDLARRTQRNRDDHTRIRSNVHDTSKSGVGVPESRSFPTDLHSPILLSLKTAVKSGLIGPPFGEETAFSSFF